MTKNFDPNYLKQKEEELIKLFYEKLIKSEKAFLKEIERITKNHTEDSEFYRKCQEIGPFKKLQRKEKLKEIIK